MAFTTQKEVMGDAFTLPYRLTISTELQKWTDEGRKQKLDPVCFRAGRLSQFEENWRK